MVVRETKDMGLQKYQRHFSIWELIVSGLRHKCLDEWPPHCLP